MKEEILIESFNILKDDIEENKGSLAEIIKKMIKINLNLAVDMWRFIIVNSHPLLQRNGYGLTGGIIYEFEKEIGISKLIEIFKKENDILEGCFLMSEDVYHYIIFKFLKEGSVDLCNRIFELILENRYKDNSFGYYIEEVSSSYVDYLERIGITGWDSDIENDIQTEDAQKAMDLILKWINAINDREQKARLNVILIEYI